MTRPATLLIGGVVLALSLILIRNHAGNAHDQFVESLYQQVQSEHRAEFIRRQANIAKLEAAHERAAQVYLAEIDFQANEADKKIAALKWRSNEELRRARASNEETLQAKAAVETALGEMTLCRDQLIVAARAREQEIFRERQALRIETAAAVAAKTNELDRCEKARKEALARSAKRTWISIGPGGSIYMADGQVRASASISFQIPIIEIKSPFKRF
jgi:hypothetical protein